MSAEVVMTAGYAGVLIVSAFVLEWLSSHTHQRALRYRTAGFAYNETHDHWTCPERHPLWPREFDAERRFVRYRAHAHVCNACKVKSRCTDSEHGREIVRPLDPWPHSEAGRFHRVIALVIVGLAWLIAVVELIRHHRPDEALLLAGVIVAALAAGWWLSVDLHTHPANFPEATAAQGLGLPVTGADGVRTPSRWASQNRGEVTP
jgi:hypothetical protein